MQPRVTCVCLYADRPQFAEAMLKAFRAQTYERKHLIIYDNGREPFPLPIETYEGIVRGPAAAIGSLRNTANGLTASDIIVTMDVDDFSHPNRIAEQVALLQASGADAVGYNEMLFWRQGKLDRVPSEHPLYNDLIWKPGEAWLYTSPVLNKPTLGTSLCYWRKTWERKPFNPNLPNNSESRGEDYDFIQGLKCAAVSALNCGNPAVAFGQDGPAMIARIHGANSTRYNIEDARGSSWKRVPSWDQRVREILEG